MKNLSILFLSLFCISNLWAQDSVITKMITTDDVVISESKFEGLKSNSAQLSQIIKSNDISRMNAQNSADVLTMGGQVFVQKSQQGGGSPVLRGFEASRILLVVDGVRMNNMIYRAGHLQNILTVDNNSVERIEVLFGPSSTVYGSDALGGVIHFRTKNPTLATEKKFLATIANTFFRYGSVNNELTGHTEIGFAGRKVGSLTCVTFSRFGDLRQGSYSTEGSAGYWARDFYAARTNVYDINGAVIGQKDTAIANRNPDIQKGTGYMQYDILQKFLIQQSDNISHVLNFQFSNTNNIPRYDRLAVTSNTTILRDAEWYYGPQRRLLAAYEFNYKNAGKLDNIAVGVNYQNIEESRHNRTFGRDFRTSRIETVHVIGFHADILKKIKAHRISAGLDGQINFLKSKAFDTDVNVDTTRAASTRYPDGKNNMNYIALYATHQWDISPKLILSDGLRYTFVNLHSTLTNQSQDFFPLPYNELKNMYNALSANIGLVGKPGAGFKISVLFATGFHAPNVDDMAKIFESVPGSVVVPNSKLKHEYTFNSDLTIEKTFSDKVRLGVTGFYTFFLNANGLAPAQFNGQDSIIYDGQLSRVLSNQSLGKAFIVGVSGRLEADVADWVSLYGNVTYTYGRVTTNPTAIPLDHIPPVYGSVGIRTHYKWLRTDFFTIFNGKKRVADYNMLGEDNFGQATPDGAPAWFTLNARVGFYPVKAFGIEVGCDNMMDMRYRHFASGISAPGRNFFVTVRVFGN